MTTLLVTSVGGHLAELDCLMGRLDGIDGDRHWVTYDTSHSRSMLEGERVTFLDYTGPRDPKAILRHLGVARAMFRRGHPYSTVISAGSGIALSFLPLAQRCGASSHYIESFTRTQGPSTTGRLLSRVPGIALYTQHARWHCARWRFVGSLFDGFQLGAPATGSGEIRRVLVTLGTMEHFGFRRLIERVCAVVPPDVDVLWQVGCTDITGMPIDGHRQLPQAVMRLAIDAADVVVAHAGCGSAIAALKAGKQPVLVPRLKAYGENVDDHQVLLGRELAARGLALVRSADELSFDDLRRAARSTVDLRSEPPHLRLVDPSRAQVRLS